MPYHAFQLGERRLRRPIIAGLPPGLQACNLLRLGLRVNLLGSASPGEWTFCTFSIGVDADYGLSTGLDSRKPTRVRGHESGFHRAGFDCTRDIAKRCHLLTRLNHQSFGIRLDHAGASEDIGMLQDIGFIGNDLLRSQTPLLIPGTRQAQCLIPGRQLHGTGASILRQHYGQHLDKNAVDVILRLLLGKSQRVNLHTIAKAPELRVFYAVALAADLIPQAREGA